MSNKVKQIYECGHCGAQSLKWSGRCLECGKWGTLQESIVEEGGKRKEREGSAEPAKVVDLSQVEKKDYSRLRSGITEVDRVLGGGVVPGSLILLSGDPGIGKSTLASQIMKGVAGDNRKVGYISGEESAGQVKERMERLNCLSPGIKFIGDTNIEKILSSFPQEGFELLVVDSIQTIHSRENESDAGSVGQIRATASKLLEFSKKNNVAVVLIGHITKDGQLAGPKTLEHIVDTVLYLENEATEKNYCLLRGIKNRFGSVNEVGVFEMTENGFTEITNSSSIFLESGDSGISGSVISCVLDGNKPFFVDVQALVTKTVFGYPQRRSSGLDANRLQVLASVLTKRAGINLTNQDIVLNIVGGLRVSDPALDLSVCMAIVSSFIDRVVPRSTLMAGEVGLGGEIRNISGTELRLKEAERMGFAKAVIPQSKKKISCDLDITTVAGIKEAMNNL